MRLGSHPLNLVLRFALELAGLLSFSWWGWRAADGFLRALLAIGLPLGAAAVWGTFNVPDDPSRSGGAPVVVPGWVRLAIEVAFFALASAAWYTISPAVGIAFAVLAVIHYALSLDRIRWLLSA
jgi:hypothetical protein